MSQPNCPKCNSEYSYQDGSLWICPTCGHEWSEEVASSATDEQPSDGLVRDANGNTLQDGDSVTVLKELKIKGASSSVKVGTKVKNIKIVDEVDGHDISCRIDGIGQIYLKSKFVRKSN